jgi:hypothetical protein
MLRLTAIGLGMASVAANAAIAADAPSWPPQMWQPTSLEASATTTDRRVPELGQASLLGDLGQMHWDQRQDHEGDDRQWFWQQDPTLLAAMQAIEADEREDEAAPPQEGEVAPKTDLAAAAQNPIASTTRLPFENNFLFNAGEDRETGYILNFQPVIPQRLSEEWNVIHRPIIPLMFTPGAVSGLPSNPGQAVGFDDTFGLGDINYTPFFSPRKSETLIWGVGPSISIPTATDDVLGSGKWAAGPSFVVLTVQKPIVGGVLFQHLWSFAGDSDRDSINRTLVQPFINYNMDDGWYLVSSPIITANWSADSGERWTVPLGGGAGRLFAIGDQPVNISMQAFYNVERPIDAPEWQLQFTFMLLFPN